MKKQTTLNAPHPAHDAAIPPWGDAHIAAWDRAKEALRRDWEQTLSYLSSRGGASLNQSAADAVMQAAGGVPIPAREAKTHPDDPADVARHAEAAREAVDRARAEVAAARDGIASAQAQASEEIAQEQREGLERVTKQREKIEAIGAEAREAIAQDAREGEERLREQQEKVDEVRATVRARVAGVREKADLEIARQRGRIADLRREWGQIEPAVRYGYGARLEHAGGAWDELVEGRLMIGWAEMNAGGVWEEALPFVRRGWDAARVAS